MLDPDILGRMVAILCIAPFVMLPAILQALHRKGRL